MRASKHRAFAIGYILPASGPALAGDFAISITLNKNHVAA